MKLCMLVLLVIVLVSCTERHVDSNTPMTESVRAYPANQLKPQNCENMSWKSSSGAMILENCETARKIICTGYICVEEKE